MTAASSPAAQPLYDARRGVYYTKPVLRGWLHLLCFAASLVSGPLLLAGGRGAARIVLDVDAENTTSALRLYQSTGMTPRPAFTIWEKRPAPPSDTNREI